MKGKKRITWKNIQTKWLDTKALKQAQGVGFISASYFSASEKTKAMLHLMCELNDGRRSGEEEGYVSSENVRAHFHGKRL